MKIKNVIKNIKGFTLIEMLVVVLIIGILAAIAVPQYQKAVMRARIVQGIIDLNAIEKAQTNYNLANGSYASNIDDLDITINSSNLYMNSSFGKSSFGSLLLEWVWFNGQHRCIGLNAKGKEYCISLGATPMTHGNNSETIQYYLLNQ